MEIEWIGNKQIAEGPYGSCALFDGSSCVKLEKRPIENMYKTKWSVVFPAYITSTAESQFLINFQSHSTDNLEYNIRIAVTNNQKLFFYTEAEHHDTLWVISPENTISMNKWFLVAVTSDGENIKLYYNGEVVAEGTFTNGSFYKEESTIFVGGSVDSAYPLYVLNGGMIGKIDFYDECLSQECIANYLEQ